VNPLVVLGSNGQLGIDLVSALRSLNRQVVALSRSDVDVRDHETMAALLERHRPSVVINTTAFHKVEECERDPEQAFAVNALAVRDLAIVANRLQARLIHMSTDYVFDGASNAPYTEDDRPNPLNVYGTSKVAGEFFVRNLCDQGLVVRTSGLYGAAGSSGKGGNFVQTMLRLGRERGTVRVVRDQRLSPTFTADLARAISRLADTPASGIVHVTNGGSCSWYEFAVRIFELAGLRADVVPITTAESQSSVRRPPYSVLADRRLQEIGVPQLRHWHEALADYMRSINTDATAMNQVITTGAVN
jgi:dTDP-4-dehydrorhamnose reductase